jgi:hypothetical protein
LNKLVGLAQVKAAVAQLLEQFTKNVQLEEQEKPTLKLNLNRMFLGNPGQPCARHSDRAMSLRLERRAHILTLTMEEGKEALLI